MDEEMDDKNSEEISDEEIMMQSQNVQIIKKSDMNHKMQEDSVKSIKECVIMSLEKQPSNYEFASKNVKELMDKKYGKSWHCVIGEGFGFNVTYEMKNMLFLYFNGNIAILVFKAL